MPHPCGREDDGTQPIAASATRSKEEIMMSHSTFTTAARSQSQLDEFGRRTAVCWILLVVGRSRTVRDRARPSGNEVDQPAGGISEPDCPQASPPGQGSCLSRLESVARAVPLIVAEKAEWPPRRRPAACQDVGCQATNTPRKYPPVAFNGDDPVADVELQTLVCNHGNHPVRDVRRSSRPYEVTSLVNESEASVQVPLYHGSLFR